MSTDFNIRPVGAPVAASIIRPQSEAVKAAVPTELPAPKIATAVDATTRIRTDRQAESDNLSQRVVIDRAAAEVVYSVVDNRTSLVVRQYPDEARLRSRAYQRSLDDAKEAKQSEARTKVNQKA